MYEIEQSTTQCPLLFYMTLASDHLSPATGLSPTVVIRKPGGSFASPAGAVSEIAHGWYQVAGNATDSNTLGPIALHATAATADDCDLVAALIVAYNPQDAKLGITYPGLGADNKVLVSTDAQDLSATLSVNSKKIGAVTQTGRDLGASVLLSSGTGTGQLDFTAGVVKSNLAQILGTALTETAGLIAGAFKKFFNVASPSLTCVGVDQTGDSYARLGAPAGASVSADVAAVKTDSAAIKAKTDNLPVFPAAVGSAMTLTSGERDSIADAHIGRNIAGGSSTGRTVGQSYAFTRNKVTIVGTTMTVYAVDDTTVLWTGTITTTPGDPISAIDPA